MLRSKFKPGHSFSVQLLAALVCDTELTFLECYMYCDSGMLLTQSAIGKFSPYKIGLGARG